MARCAVPVLLCCLATCAIPGVRGFFWPRLRAPSASLPHPQGESACIQRAVLKAKGSGSCEDMSVSSANLAAAQLMRCITGNLREGGRAALDASSATVELLRTGLQMCCRLEHNNAIRADVENAAALLEEEGRQMGSLRRDLQVGMEALKLQSSKASQLGRLVLNALEGAIAGHEESLAGVRDLTRHVERGLDAANRAAEISASLSASAAQDAQRVSNFMQSALLAMQDSMNEQHVAVGVQLVGPAVHVALYLSACVWTARRPRPWSDAPNILSLVPVMVDVVVNLCWSPATQVSSGILLASRTVALLAFARARRRMRPVRAVRTAAEVRAGTGRRPATVQEDSLAVCD